MKIKLPEYNSFLDGNPNASESEVFEVITFLMGASSRIRTRYYQMNVVHSAMMEGEATEGIIKYMHDQGRGNIWDKQLMYEILTSIPHSDEHDVI